MSTGAADAWFVRYAGRDAGPYDTRQLRTMAQRGSLTRFHQLSRDSQRWQPASEVRTVFNADGTAVPATAPLPDTSPVPEQRLPEYSGTEQLPTGASQFGAFVSSDGRVGVRIVQFIALSIAVVALAAPTSRNETTNALQWWPVDSALVLAACGLTAVVVAAWWVIVFLPPAPIVGAIMASVSGLASLALGALLWQISPCAVPAALALPAGCILIACESHTAQQLKALGIGTAIVAGLGLIAGVVLLVTDFSLWRLATCAALVPGCAMLVGTGAWGASSTPDKPRLGYQLPRGLFVLGVIACVALACTLFIAALAGLNSSQPMLAAKGAVASLLIVCLSVLAWSGAHDSLSAVIKVRPLSEFEPQTEPQTEPQSETP